MKISKSKQELARIISENGGWRDRAKFSSQDKDGEVFHYATKPTINAGREVWHHKGCIGEGEFTAETLPNWHQSCLSRAEYFHLYPAPDADGWIEWNGGECPVDKHARIDIRMTDGTTHYDTDTHWGWNADSFKITHYRLHKPEQSKPEFCESVMRSIPEPDEQVWTNTPSIEQLAADYRNTKYYAERKQQEADAAKVDADEKLRVLELACEAIGLIVSPITEKQEPELVITDWRDLQAGDVIQCIGDVWDDSFEGREAVVTEIESPNYKYEYRIRARICKECDWGADFKFIRRP